ncbi:LCP family protein [Micromonospora sp. KC721]|uniref:LCP family protein n=1 Tax=Micromonospora sp. KC721 TaxID=2530380 RepID=UPI001FB5AB28|nr:LCP family protein [Micromonospora sp. KC721]
MELRAAFARHEELTPPVAPLRAAIDRLVVRRRRRRRRLQVGTTALAVLVLLGLAAPQVVGLPVERAGSGVLSGDPGARSGALNVLLVGVDGSTRQPVRRADSVLLVHVPADRSRAYLISLPRDLEVPIPGHGTDKLSAAFAFGAGVDRPDLSRGYELTSRTVADLTGVRLDAGAVLTYPVLRELTDTVGGVEVCLPSRVTSVHTARVFRAGCQRLDGAASVDLLRQRRGLPDGAFDRDRTAQIFAAGLVRRAREQGVLNDPARLSALVATVGAKMAVASGGPSLLDLLRVVPELKSLDPVGINLPVGAPAGRSWLVGMDPVATPQFLAALRQDRLAQWVAEHPGRITPMG